MLDDPAAVEADPGEHAEEVAWKTAVDAAPWLLGEAPPGGVDPEEALRSCSSSRNASPRTSATRTDGWRADVKPGRAAADFTSTLYALSVRRRKPPLYS